MKVFTIEDGFTYSQTHAVVADSMAEAERIYKTKYPGNTIKAIKLYAEYVQIQGIEEMVEEKQE